MLITIIKGFKWFDKINGNTYNNAMITTIRGDTGEVIGSHEVGYEYGYGCDYFHRAVKLVYSLYGEEEHTIINTGSHYTTKKNCKNCID